MAFGALTVFFDELSEDDTEPSRMQDFLSDAIPEDQYMYRAVKTVPDEKKLIDDIKESNDNLDIIYPAPMCFVFCYYLDLKDLTDEKVSEFFRRADAFGALQPDAGQHYVICFRYKADSLGKEERDRVCPLLVRLMTKDPVVSREIYLFYATALQHFESQEKGLARCLYQESRTAGFPVNGVWGSWLKTITYDEFYENRVAKCDAELARIQSYLEDAADPDLKTLKAKANAIYREAHEGYRASLRKFRARESLFPVNVEDFERGLFKAYPKIDFHDGQLQKARVRYQEEREQQFLRKVNVKELMNVMEAYHDPDLEALSDFLQADNAKDSFLSSDGTSEVDKEAELRFRNGVAKILWQKLEDFLKSKNREKIKGDKLARQKRLKKEKAKAGVYKNLAECCNEIEARTKFVGIHGKLGEIVAERVWVSPGCAAALAAGKLPKVKNLPAPEPEALPDIAPPEIAVLRVYGLLGLKAEDAVGNLSAILS